MPPLVCTVTGSFHRNGRPAKGLVRFTPERLWVMQGGTTWAALAPTVELDEDGSFEAGVTATDTDAIHWRYQVETPAGTYRVEVLHKTAGHRLKELMNEHRPRPRT